MSKTFFMLAGEASGDAHAARLMRQLSALDPAHRFVGLGGTQMVAAGLEVFKDLSGMQVVGFWEVIKHYGFFRRVFFELLERLKQTRTDALICVDYPGFNVRFAEEAKKLGIPAFYYIVPQVWAWKPKRAAKMARCVSRAFCVFEFEPPFFERYGLKTTFIGHPLIDGESGGAALAAEVARARILGATGGAKIVSFLPGSRANEVRHHLGVMLKAFARVRTEGVAAVGLVSLPRGLNVAPPENVALVRAESQLERDVAILCNPAQAEALRPVASELNALSIPHSRLLCGAADFSVVKSGTSTLEAGLSGQPLCAMYRGGTASYLIARTLVNIPVFSLVNIVLGRYAIPELLQSEVTPVTLAAEIQRGLHDENYRAQQRAALAELPRRLGGPGASARAAREMVRFIEGGSTADEASESAN